MSNNSSGYSKLVRFTLPLFSKDDPDVWFNHNIKDVSITVVQHLAVTTDVHCPGLHPVFEMVNVGNTANSVIKLVSLIHVAKFIYRETRIDC